MRSAIGKQPTNEYLVQQPASSPDSSPCLGHPLSSMPPFSSSYSIAKPAAAAAEPLHMPCSSTQASAAPQETSAAPLPEHYVLHSMIHSAVRQAVREEASAALALASSTLAREFQSVIKTAVREAVKDELGPVLSSAMAASAAATALAEHRVGERVAAALEAATDRLRAMLVDAAAVAPARS
jgi:hypothetical protein